MLSSKQIIEKTEKFGAANYKPKDVVIERASGVMVCNPEGEQFYDMLSAYSAHNFGHLHRRLLRRQRNSLIRLL
jgi:ornithine--oxo-acid transaminase